MDLEEGDILSVEDIQDMVEEALMDLDKPVAKSYINYRFLHGLIRESNTTDKTIKELINGENEYWKEENSNKNAGIVTTQRDYIAGVTSTDISRRFLLPKDVVEAHDKGIIHFHDMDYFAQKSLHNCFDVNTRFITSKGVKSFKDFKDGDKIIVLTHTGEWKTATVKNYGKQELYRIIFKRGQGKEKEVLATKNHRWILNNGEVTNELKIGDTLFKAPVINEINFEKATLKQKQLWCKGFAYGDGQNCSGWNGTKIRLCGRKNIYKNNFISAGYTCTTPANFNGDNEAHIPEYNKDVIPTMEFNDYKYFIHGLLSADGDRPTGKGSTKNNEFKGIQITGKEKNKKIYDLLNISGYYVSGCSDLTNEVTNYGKRTDETKRYRFQANQSYRNWKVKDIQFCKVDEVWCLNVEDNHSFVLENGIVTGNCELINLEDMLQNGTVINGVMIEKPHKLLTAMTIATQIITAVTSSSYGGATITLTHLAPFVRESRKRIKNEVAHEYYELTKKCIDEDRWEREDDCYSNLLKIIEERLHKEIISAVQTFNYQCNSMTNTNGQAPFLSVAMYISENPEYEKETVMLIEEFLNQRYQGFKNETGIYVTPAFPKLLYFLDENNCSEDSKYWWLTKLAAKCTAKRLVPDYISVKIMKRDKIDSNGNGNAYPCMGKQRYSSCKISLTMLNRCA